MRTINEKLPDPKELEKELSDFLARKFGPQVKLSPPIVMAQTAASDKVEPPVEKSGEIRFDLKPEALIAYLDQYIVKQNDAKAVLATKICTHFNRIKRYQSSPDERFDPIGGIKNNVLMLGPTGVGKTYMIRLIAQKIGVPFVKGDATKFSETGYVGGDVEDLVRDLVHEADGDINRAQYGIIYIDEIDKIASSRNLIGADVSRTGVQRALLKPMEETDVDLKVPHDPISMLQEIERYRQTGKRETTSINTRHVLFIMSGAFAGLEKIIQKRCRDQSIGFGATLADPEDNDHSMTQVTSEDLIQFGFESEFVGRLPVRTVFERLDREDLFQILANPNNPIVLGKKLDFAAYGIDIKFDTPALHLMAERAFDENTGARGLVSAVENALIRFERTLPSTDVAVFPVTAALIEDPEKGLAQLTDKAGDHRMRQCFDDICRQEIDRVSDYLTANRERIGAKSKFALSPSRIGIIARYYSTHILDIEKVLARINDYYDQAKAIELHFLKKHGINIVLEEQAIDHIINQCIGTSMDIDTYYQQLTRDFEYGLQLVRDKTGRRRFFITQEALEGPEQFIASLIQNGLRDFDEQKTAATSPDSIERTPER